MKVTAPEVGATQVNETLESRLTLPHADGQPLILVLVGDVLPVKVPPDAYMSMPREGLAERTTCWVAPGVYVVKEVVILQAAFPAATELSVMPMNDVPAVG